MPEIPFMTVNDAAGACQANIGKNNHVRIVLEHDIVTVAIVHGKVQIRTLEGQLYVQPDVSNAIYVVPESDV